MSLLVPSITASIPSLFILLVTLPFAVTTSIIRHYPVLSLSMPFITLLVLHHFCVHHFIHINTIHLRAEVNLCSIPKYIFRSPAQTICLFYTPPHPALAKGWGKIPYLWILPWLNLSLKGYAFGGRYLNGRACRAFLEQGRVFFWGTIPEKYHTLANFKLFFIEKWHKSAVVYPKSAVHQVKM